LRTPLSECLLRRISFDVFRCLKSGSFQKSLAISRTVNLLLLRTVVLTLAIISSLLDVDGRPERESLSMEVLPSFTFWRRNYFFLILAHSVYKM